MAQMIQELQTLDCAFRRAKNAFAHQTLMEMAQSPEDRSKDVESTIERCCDMFSRIDTVESTIESAYNVRTHIIYWQELRTGDVANEDVRQLCIWNTTARTPESNQLDLTEEGRDQLCFKHVRDLQNKTCFNMCQEESSKRSFLLRALLAFGLCICCLLGACVAR